MEISGETFRRLCQDEPGKVAKALDLTLAEVEEAMRKALDDKADEVISIWIARYLKYGVS